MKTDFIEYKRSSGVPRIPLEGFLDLTYRCNNNCRHCWLRIPSEAPDRSKELSVDEIKQLVDDARKMGCRQWHISGGEPMLKPDFPEIFDYITSNSAVYTLNTNGTLITPSIARLLRKKGSKLIALYGATAQVHDHITRTPGSFEAVMQGMAYLKESGAGFTVQLVPMQDNYFQLQSMIELAKSLSPIYRIGAAWLYLSASGDSLRNQEIKYQRLSPETVVEFDRPDVAWEDDLQEERHSSYTPAKIDGNRLFASCIEKRWVFHVDPYGMMTFCCFIKDPELRYNLRQGNFQEGWDNFIPSLADKIKKGKEYRENCGSCELNAECRWCPAYAYLEHGRYEGKIEYLCAAAQDKWAYKEKWKDRHRRYYRIADITLQVEADLPIRDTTFLPKFRLFEVKEPGADVILLRHSFFLPEVEAESLGKEYYRRAPWAIYRKGNSWIYAYITNDPHDNNFYQLAVFNHAHTRGRIYSPDGAFFEKGNVHALSQLTTDQVLLARLLADRDGCYLHSCGAKLGGKGFLFVGHSGAGKSTMASMLEHEAEILCDDRIILRRHPEGFRIHGTWSGGELRHISPHSAPLQAIFFLSKAQENRLTPLENRVEILKDLQAYLIRPFVTVDWWEKILSLLDTVANEVPCYHLYFDRSGQVVDLLKQL